jgi:hypothetical protein
MRSMSRRSVRALAVVPALGLLALAGCGDEGDAGAATSPTVSSPTPSSSVATEPTTPATTPNTKSPSNTAAPSGEYANVTIDVTIAGGKVSPSGKNIKMAVGSKVKITGVSDVHDEIHVHGYDKTLELDPGKPGWLIFKADRKGSFEVETHETGRLIAKLVVS